MYRFRKPKQEKSRCFGDWGFFSAGSHTLPRTFPPLLPDCGDDVTGVLHLAGLSVSRRGLVGRALWRPPTTLWNDSAALRSTEIGSLLSVSDGLSQSSVLSWKESEEAKQRNLLSNLMAGVRSLEPTWYEGEHQLSQVVLQPPCVCCCARRHTNIHTKKKKKLVSNG